MSTVIGQMGKSSVEEMTKAARLIGKREPYEVDMDNVMDACKANHKVLELNAYPERLDRTRGCHQHFWPIHEGGVSLHVDQRCHLPGLADAFQTCLNLYC